MVTQTFRSLAIYNYRLYFTGQIVSLCGTWMQRVAMAWLVLEVTGSGTMVGTVTAVQFLPILLLAPVGGLLADRFDNRRILYITQTVASATALILGLLVIGGVVELWMIYLAAVSGGLAAAFDTPARQTFVMEMVGREQLTNAVSLNTTAVNAARIVGPALAGLLIVTLGTGWCFVINAFTYVALIVALRLMRKNELNPVEISPRTPNQILEGFKYTIRTPAVRTPLILLAVAGTFAYNFQVVLPLLARFAFDGGARAYGVMSSAMGVGAVVGGLWAASRPNRPPLALAKAGVIFGSLIILTSLMPALWAAICALIVLGGSSVTFIALGNATIQLAAEPQMRGRVMGVYTMAFMGTTPIGSPTMGWIGEHVGARWAMGIGGLAVLVAALLVFKPLAALTTPLAPDLPLEGLPPEKA